MSRVRYRELHKAGAHFLIIDNRDQFNGRFLQGNVGYFRQVTGSVKNDAGKALIFSAFFLVVGKV